MKNIKEQIKKGKDMVKEQELPKVPFRSYTTDEDKQPDKYARPISIRLNPTERAWLNEIKEDLDIKSDSRALKIAAMAGKNVLQTFFGRDILKYLFRKERKRKGDL